MPAQYPAARHTLEGPRLLGHQSRGRAVCVDVQAIAVSVQEVHSEVGNISRALVPARRTPTSQRLLAAAGHRSVVAHSQLLERQVAQVGQLQTRQEDATHLHIALTSHHLREVHRRLLLRLRAAQVVVAGVLVLLGRLHLHAHLARHQVQRLVAVLVDVEHWAALLLQQQRLEAQRPCAHSAGQVRLPRVVLRALHEAADVLATQVLEGVGVARHRDGRRSAQLPAACRARHRPQRLVQS
mmetsp:Transcript_22139/g.41182  ORF Transcript_22139/g.41182 Transcript_22139/m.41182 type:complete len:240 (-) Transcript_22139:1109-1828(-)